MKDRLIFVFGKGKDLGRALAIALLTRVRLVIRTVQKRLTI